MSKRGRPRASFATFPGVAVAGSVTEADSEPDLTAWPPPADLQAAGRQFWTAFCRERLAQGALREVDRTLVVVTGKMVDQVAGGQAGLHAADVLRRRLGELGGTPLTREKVHTKSAFQPQQMRSPIAERLTQIVEQEEMARALARRVRRERREHERAEAAPADTEQGHE